MTLLSAAQIAALVGQPPPTPEQERVVESPLAPALVVAGAGSGKTETMAARVVWLLANGLVAPEQVLGLTFTRKAAAELAERVRRRLRRLARAAAEEGVVLPGAAVLAGADGDGLGGLVRPTVATYNAYASSLVSDHALRLGLDPSARLLGEAAQWQLAHEVVEAWTGDVDTDAATSTVVDAVLSLSGALDEHLLTPAEAQAGIAGIVDAINATPHGPGKRTEPYRDVAALVRLLGERSRVLDLVATYRDRKRAADAIDFGDQVALAARLALDVPEVAAGERARFRVVLLDEYQDTSYAQLTLLAALFGDGHPVTAVGDPHQSIYGWRGASAGGLEGFPTSFPVVGPDGDRRPADVHSLSTSWRNDRRILDAANVVAAPLRASTSRVEVPVLAARPGAGDGRVHAHVAETVEDEARAIAEFVKARWRPAGAGVDRVTAAVLCRKRSQFPVVQRALRAAGLPVEVVGLGGLLATPEVVDLVAALQAAHDPSRGDALMRLLTGGRTRLGAADLHALGAWSAELAGRAGGGGRAGRDPGVQADVVDERSIVDALDELPRPGWRSATGRELSATARTRLADLARLLTALRSHTYLAVPELVGEAERLLGLDIEVAARAGVSPGRARANLDAFRDVAVEFARTADHPTLGGFLAWLDAADTRESGLDMPVAEPDPDAVQVITVHAAKGLEWDVVAVAGLVDGVLPATRTRGKDGPKDSAWLTGLGTLPYPLRGDRHDLPDFPYAGAEHHKDLEERRQRFVLDAGAHQVAEERRLAYVALTRARTDLLLSAAWWGDSSGARVLSIFLEELVTAGLVTEDGWMPPPEAGTGNPREDQVLSAVWPADPFAADDGPGRRPAVEEAAALVRAALTVATSTAEDASRGAVDDRAVGHDAGTGAPAPGHGTTAAVPGDGTTATADVVAAGPPGAAPSRWEHLADRLLAEQDRVRRPDGGVELPAHLSASSLVRLHADPAEFARGLRRPVPREPSPQARRGTRFHAWVEGWYGAASLVDVDALPGADDDSTPVDGDEEALRASFLRTPWADRSPLAIEVDVETSVDGYVLRSRIDAVFPDQERTDVEGRAVVVVDWKTGAPPTDPDARASRELQLAVYRLAWSRWTGTPLDLVRAAFCYVGTGETVYPQRLLGEDEITALLRRATSDEPHAPEPDLSADVRMADRAWPPNVDRGTSNPSDTTARRRPASAGRRSPDRPPVPVRADDRSV
ncbi:UvrD-helicase domain-containing protein [Cellulomonas sp. H30R-01]|uniref:ATP-dependent DNA helicase n=1 Tax=Cellulomonas sp. H30R-01 TaxID=2704467 RepID=UPI00138C37DE|nr:ATP-dependent DNA helicase [Cellulomonas sp. H30R-01]QHT56464.1 UvrD-helicase domain-containing protein [Cellulomonas sp. H30R-01]